MKIACACAAAVAVGVALAADVRISSSPASRRILVTHLTDVQNSGMKFTADVARDPDNASYLYEIVRR